jgi:hypothetical protein
MKKKKELSGKKERGRAKQNTTEKERTPRVYTFVYTNNKYPVNQWITGYLLFVGIMSKNRQD